MSSNDIKTSLSDYFRHQPVERAWMFGSFARGEETENSDIDLLVDLDDTQAVGLRFFGKEKYRQHGSPYSGGEQAAHAEDKEQHKAHPHPAAVPRIMPLGIQFL